VPEEARLKKLAKDISEGRLAPVYLFEGPDDYRRRRAVEALSRAVFGDAGPGTAAEYLGAVRAAEVCDRARGQSLFAAKRLLVASGAEKFDDTDLAALSAYAAAPAPDAVLVFGAEGLLDRRKKTFKFFEKLDAVYTFGFLQGEARRARVAAEAKRLGLKVKADAVSFLDQALAPDLYTVVRELEKLACYAGDEELDAAAVAAVAVTSRHENAYEMVRLVVE